MFDGSMTSKVLVILDKQCITAKAEGLPCAGEVREVLERAFRGANIPLDEICYCLLEDKDEIKNHAANILVPVGDRCLTVITGLTSIDKWHASIVSGTAVFGMRKCIAMFHPDRLRKEYGLSANNLLCASKIKTEMAYKEIRIPARQCLIQPTFAQACDYLKRAVKSKTPVGIDIETGSGLINTFGVALSKTDSMALRIDHTSWSKEHHYYLWSLIRDLLEGPTPKVYQNFIYETLFLSRYGIRCLNTKADTMWMMKFLNPEFDKGLDNVGRFYTPFPYWKDDRDDWTNIRDWPAHLLYNCYDTIGTLWAYEEMEDELRERGLYDLFYNFVMRLAPVVTEMCSNGLIVHEDRLALMLNEAQTKLTIDQKEMTRIFFERLGREVNPRSPKQLKAALTEMGIKLPSKTNKETGVSAVTADKKALTKLRKKYPKEGIIENLIRISKEQKFVSSYLSFDYNHDTKIANYTLDGNSTETNRWASYTDPWGRGFNAQTVPKKVRSIFCAEPGHHLIEIDLSQAESRYVAYDSPEPRLMELLQKGEDVHRFVAARIFNKHMDMITNKERQLGKKSGHAANYGVGPRTFAESALVENDIFITEMEAKRIINGYFSVFPGIRRRQQRIQDEIRRTKKLVTPMGRERYFYNRISDACFREAYAHCPQSVIPDIMSCLMLYLYERFPQLKFRVQIHDAILFSCPDELIREVGEAAHDLKAWHPKIALPGGDLLIPVDVSYGQRWVPMDKL